MNKTKMEKLTELMSLAVEINGTECRESKLYDKPAVMVEYCGHIATLDIRVYLHGWKEDTRPDFTYRVRFDSLYSKEECGHVYAELKRIKEMMENEK